MIKNVDEFKDRVDYWLGEVSSLYDLREDVRENVEDDIKELKRIIDLINCDVIWKLDGVCSFESEIDLNKIINILSQGGKIKKLSEVNFDE